MSFDIFFSSSRPLNHGSSYTDKNRDVLLWRWEKLLRDHNQYRFASGNLATSGNMSEISHFKPKTDSLPMTQITQAVGVLIFFFYFNSLSILISLMAQNFSGSIILTIFAVPAKIDSHPNVKDEDKRSNQPTGKQLRCHGTKKLIITHWFTMFIACIFD